MNQQQRRRLTCSNVNWGITLATQIRMKFLFICIAHHVGRVRSCGHLPYTQHFMLVANAKHDRPHLERKSHIGFGRGFDDGEWEAESSIISHCDNSE